ncbi:sulfatase-like hydrolase/transferase [Verrucomicrobiaceae bacterium 227]
MKFLYLTLLLTGSLLAKPKLLIILADDMGYGDLGCSGSTTIKTPHIDELAARGIFCSRGYVAAAVCSPSRAGLLTGRDPRRFGYEGNLNQGAANYATRPDLLGLPTSEHTLADHLKALDYHTALIGKWHQGTAPGFHPNTRGFDHFVGMLGGSHSYFPTAEKNQLERNGEALTEFSSPYLTDFFSDEAISWIEQKKEDPWFLFLSYNAPHSPMHATAEDLARYAHIENKKRRTYAAMMHAMDRGIGRVINSLKETGQLDDTLIVFFSDNGGATTNGSWNGLLSGRKGTALEGGVRVPFIFSWPAKLPKGQRHEGIVSALDLVPTFTAAAGGKPLPLQQAPSHEDARNRKRANEQYGEYDGRNLLPALNGHPSPERLLFWRLQGQSAILDGEFKLIRPSHRPAQLFQPATDPGEQSDVTANYLAKRDELFQKLAEWESLRATVPLWGSSPTWNSQSAKIYDSYPPAPEPK